MSGVAFRDSSIVVIDTSRTSVHAILGLGELLPTPAVEIKARVGLRRSLHDSNGLSNGHAQPAASTSRAASAIPMSSVKVNDYLVGAQLDSALAAGEDIVVSWPFAEGDISDWTQAEAIWKHTLFGLLHLRRTQNESPVLLTVPPTLSRSSLAMLSQLFFERFNVAAFTLLFRPVAQIYAGNALSGIVVDIGEEYTDVNVIYDGFPVRECTESVKLGLQDCREHLVNILRTNQSVMTAISSPDAPLPEEDIKQALLSLVNHLLASGLVKPPAPASSVTGFSASAMPIVEEPEDGVTDIAAIVLAGKEKAVIENNMKKRASAKATAAEQAKMREIEAMDLVEIKDWEWGLREVVVGRERHRLCEPLFDPKLCKKDPNDGVWPIHEVIGAVVQRADVDQRQYVWQGLFVTGELARYIKGMGTSLQSRLMSYILSQPDQHNDVQARHIRVLKIPEYFAEYREKGDGLASFLGAGIVAKIAFHDPNGKNFVSKGEYAAKGPPAIIEMSASLL
ncbi:actin-like protein [Gloeophyllum trabeum ATCC 11539]|uniref:Actin-like protein n=1 Tax=Gloeophyllum trabeum (strain ATCC 11539 / FP-39264 / Madison 617) TaxID=670483 RepID=S7QA44_GLOTA|nr:actin-like protein [Gloeophyllum trabeum ATCC 11539]EPQ56387.1 actin-like protein [Gloeophyllum trabeum ATCC 11539]